MTDPTTHDERHRAAEWLRARAKMIRLSALGWERWEKAAELMAGAIESAADAYEKGGEG